MGILGTIIAILFLLGALWIIIGMIRSWLRTLSAQKWPVVPGVVTSSLIETLSKPDGRLYHQPCIEYRYEVKGQGYTGHKITVGESSLLWPARNRGPQQTVERYPLGQPVPVHYDPRQPQNAALEVKVPDVLSQIVIAGLLIAFAALFMLG